MSVVRLDSKRRAPATALPPGPAKGLFTTPDGHEVYFEDSGGPHPVLFYVYGLGCSIAHWKYSLAHFAGEPSLATPDVPAHLAGRAKAPHRQVWLDFRGHGRSPPLRGERLTIRTIVDDIKALCDDRGITQATFLGQSMGGSIALLLAATYPKLVRSLVLLVSPGRDPATFFPAQPVSRLLWHGLIGLNRRASWLVNLGHAALLQNRHLPHVRLAFREIVRHTGFNPQLSRTVDIEEYIERVLDAPPDLFLDLAGELAKFNVSRMGKHVTCPALVLAGEHDRIVPVREARRLVRQLPDGRLVVIPHGSHCPHMDDPRRVNREIEQFLDGHKA